MSETPTPKVDILSVMLTASAGMTKHAAYVEHAAQFETASGLYRAMYRGLVAAYTALDGEEDSVKEEHQLLIAELGQLIDQIEPVDDAPANQAGTPAATLRLLNATRELLKDPKDAMNRNAARSAVMAFEVK